jgi:hypothetical protein
MRRKRPLILLSSGKEIAEFGKAGAQLKNSREAEQSAPPVLPPQTLHLLAPALVRMSSRRPSQRSRLRIAYEEEEPGAGVAPVSWKLYPLG